MVKNREELLSMSSEWMNMARNDLRRQVINFMESVGTSEDQLAYILGISIDELSKIINGHGEIALSTFAKLLIATDNVIEIKPISQSPFMGRQMPNGRTMKSPATDIPFGGGMPMPKKVKRDKNGRFMREDAVPQGTEMPTMRSASNHGMPQMREMPDFGMPPVQRFGGMPGMNKRPQVAQDIKIPSVPRRELVTTIAANGWDEEIDMMNSTSDELINFLMHKGLTPEHFARMANSCREVPSNQRSGLSFSDRIREGEKRNEPSLGEGGNETARIMEMIQDELERNPQLLESVRKYMNK